MSPFDKPLEERTGYDKMAIKQVQKDLGVKTEGGYMVPGSTPITAVIKRYADESHNAYIKRCARHYGPDMIDVLATIAKDGRQSGGARVAAAGMIMDRAYGKATQTIETIAAQGKLHEIPTDLLVSMIKQAADAAAVEAAVKIQNGELPPKEPGELPTPTIIASDGQEA